VLRLAELPALSDPEMVNQLVTHMLRASAPAPSIETILHGLMRTSSWTTHTPTRLLSVSNTKDGEKRIREVYGKALRRHSLSHARVRSRPVVRKRIQAPRHARDRRNVLLNHGIFSFGETAREGYERMISW